MARRAKRKNSIRTNFESRQDDHVPFWISPDVIDKDRLPKVDPLQCTRAWLEERPYVRIHALGDLGQRLRRHHLLLRLLCAFKILVCHHRVIAIEWWLHHGGRE